MSLNVTPKSVLRAFIILIASLFLTGRASDVSAASHMQYWWYPFEKSETPADGDWHGRSPLLKKTPFITYTGTLNFFAPGPIASPGTSHTNILPLLCVGCGVQTAALSHDGDTATAAKITVTLGVAGRAGQRIVFPGTYEAGDSVVLDIEVPGAVLSLDVLGGIRLEAFNGASGSAVTTVNLNSQLVRIQLLGLGAAGKRRAIIPITGTFDRVEVTFDASLNLLSALNIYEVTATVPVTVTPSANPVIIPAGSSASFTASHRLGAATYQWYDAPSGGNLLHTGSNFTTPVLNRGVHQYWVAATTSDDKTSFIRTAVNVDIGGGPGPLWTYGDQQESPLISGVCAGCTVTDAQNAVDADPNTSSALNTVVGLLGNVSQLIHFPGTYQAGDSISVDFEVPNQLLSAAVLGGIMLESYNGNTPNGDQIFLDSSLVRLEALGAGIGSTGKFRVTIPVNTGFDGVRISTSALLAALSTTRIYEAVAFMPVTVTPPASTIPSGSTATMDASVRAPGATFTWYDAPTGGTALATTSSFTTPPLTRSKTYYAEASTPDGLTSYHRTAANVTVSGGPGPLWTYGDQQSPAVSGLCIGCLVQNPELAVDEDTTTASQVIITVGAGGSAGQLITFPGTYEAGDSISFVLGVPNQLLSAQLLSGIRVQTYNGATPNGDAVLLDNDLVNLQALGLDVTGNVGKFRVTLPVNSTFDGAQVELTGLVSGLSSLNIYEAAAFIPVTVTPEDVSVPFGNDTTLTASIRLPDATFKWYDAPTGGNLLHTGATFNTPVLVQDQTYYVEASTPDGLTSYVRTAVDVNVTVGPGSPDLSCGRAITQTNSAFGVCVLCGVNTPELAVDDNPQTASRLHVPLSLLVGGAYQRLAFGQESSVGDSVRIVVGSTTGLLNLSLLGNVTIRPRNNGAENTADVRALNNGLLHLQLLDGGTRQVISYVPSAVFDEVEIRIDGIATALTEINVYYAQQITPMATVAADTVNVCSGQPATLTATAPAGATFRWYDAPSGGNLLHTGAAFTADSVIADAVYYVEAASATTTCASEVRKPVFVKVGLASISVTATSVTIPQGATATFNVNTPDTALTYNWYMEPTGGTPVFTGPSFTTPALNATTTYYVEATTSTGCATPQRIAVVANVAITDPDVPCDIATTQISNANGLCVGCYVDNQGAAVDGSTQTFSSMHAILGLLGGYVQQTLIFPSASDVGDSIRLGISFPASLADVALLGSVQIATYNGATYNNDRTALNAALLHLQLLPGNQQALVTFAPSAVFDRVEIRLSSGIAQALNAININYAQRFIPVPVVQPDTVSTCAGGTAALSVTPVANTIYRWYSEPEGGAVLFTGADFQSGPVTTDTAFYVEAVKTSTGCANPVRAKAVVTITGAPAAPTLESTSVTTCGGSSATLRATAPAGATFRWYSQQSGGTVLFTGAEFITPLLDSSAVYYAETVSSGGCASETRTAVQVNVSAQPGTPDVTPQNAEICAGSTATITATTATPGVTFNWYATAALDSVLFTGPSFTTPALSATTTYYVVAANGQCISATPATVTIQVNEVALQPTVTINPVSGIVEYGQTATLTAASASPGATYRWYLDSAGGTPVFTGNPFITPALANTTRYYVEAVAAAGCASARTAATVNVNRNFNPGCDFANSQTFNVNGLCLGCTVNLGDNAVDNDTTNFATITQLISLLGGDITQTLNFGSLAAAGDTVKLRLSFPTGLADLSLLSAIQLTSYNGATSNGDTKTLDAAGLRLIVLGGTNQRVVLFAPGDDYDRIEIKVLGGVASALVNVNVHYANRILSSPVITPDNITICAGSQATLTATASDSATVRWYDAPSGGTPIFTGKVFTTPALTTNATYYAESFRASTNCVNPVRTPVTVQVREVPDLPVVLKGDTSICTGSSATLMARALNPAHSIRWFTTATGGTPVSLDSIFTTGALTATTIFYAEAFNGTCGSVTRVPVTVTAATAPSDPVLEANNVTICGGTTATLRVTSATTGITIRWYTVQSGGTPVFEGAEFITPAITATTIYYVEAVNAGGGCTNGGGRIPATVTVNATPAVPVLVESLTVICDNKPATLSVQNPVTGITYNWYDAATGGTLLSSGATFVTPPLTDTATYFVEAVGAGNCSSTSRATASISVQNAVDAPTVESANVTVCVGAPATLRVLNPLAGITYEWYNAPGGTRLFTGPTFVTGPLVAAANYYVSAVSAAGCSSAAQTQVSVAVTSAPALPVVIGSTTVCAGDDISLSIQNPQTGLTYTWFSTQTGGTQLAAGTSFSPTGVTATTTYYVEASTTTCTSAGRTSVTVTVNPRPPVVTVDAATKTICTGNTASLHVQNPQAGVTYRWYDVATGGAVLSSLPDFTTPALTANKDYYVEAMNSSNCSSPTRTKVSVVVTAGPAAPAVESADVAVCSGTQATLRIQNPQAGLTYDWYDAPGGNKLFTGTTFVTGLITTATNYYVAAVSAGGCSSATQTEVSVTVTTPPALPVVTGSTTVCAGSAISLSIQNPLPGVTYTWFSTQTAGTQLAQGTTFAPTGVTATTTYYVQASSGTCTSAGRTSVTVTVNPAPPVVTVDAATETICSGNTATLSVQSPQTGLTYRWYDVATGGTVLSSQPDFVTPALTANKSYYVEAVNASNCSSASRTRVNVVITAGPEAPSLSGEVTVCRGNRATSNVQNPRTGVEYRWYDAPVGGSLLFTGNTYISNPVNTRDTVYIESAIQGGNCTSSGRTQVILIPADAPATPVLVGGGTLTVCSGSTATFTVQNPVPGITYRWYDAPVNGNELQSSTDASYTTGTLTTNITVYVEAAIGAGCASGGRATATATVGTVPTPPTVTADALQVCKDSSATLRASSTQAGVIFSWYTSATGGTAVFTGPVFNTPGLTASTIYYVAAGYNGGCMSATRTPITIGILEPLPAPSVTVASRTATSVTFQWDAIQGAIGYRVSTDGGANFSQPSSGLTGTTHTVTGLQPNQTVALQVMAIGATPCANSAWFLGGGGTDNPAGNAVFVPNAFTPNNDGLNDVLFVYGTTIASIELRIFNQWGQLVFESKDKGRGWDGTMSGVKQPIGVYTYVLKATLQDGTLVQKRGTITIVR